MIIDWLEHAGIYKTLDEGIASGLQALEYLEKLDQTPGWHTTDEGLNYLIQELRTTAPDNDRWEAHRRHTDIQFILEGEERFGYANTAFFTRRTCEYDPEEDIEFFQGTGEFVTLKPGMFAIQFPHDIHLPGCSNGQPAGVKRGVIKIPWNTKGGYNHGF